MIVLWVFEYFFGCVLFLNYVSIYEDNVVGNFFCEVYFVCYDNYCYIFFSK